MNHKILATALLLSVALPSLAFAQTATGTGISESTSSSSSGSVAGALNEGNTTTVTFEGATIPRERYQAPGMAVVTPPSSSCADVIGGGGSAPAVGIVVNIPVASARCNAREDARIMLSNAQAAEATMGHGAGALDVMAARYRLSQVDENEDAYAQARAELALRQSASASASTAPSTSSEATVEDDELRGRTVLATLRDGGPEGPTQ